MARILITDDDLHLRKLVRTYADLEGYQCEEAETGAEAIEALKQEKHFDLVILDVMMPGPDGFETLAGIRRFSQIPVIMLTARDEEYDKLLGFNLGVDDYVSKPFSPKELMARVGAVLKRSSASPGQAESLQYGDLCISPKYHSVTARGEKIALPPKEFDLLLKLAQNERVVLSREKLLESVWDYNYFGDVRTVDTHIKSLREHLGEYRRTIHTVWGVGYKFEYVD
ncbi:MAG TPA: response regulator transcription factor [Candidatus Ventrimonas merdavium]|nr:response regulator transcription factor [Candidatus Ventrimonas merdavium]